ncbi:hypothetical protein [Streptomyces aureus]|uniref:hypothetical protein n=1 Tax=Streptomyces aureus TaxID=193461 RepID=UPI0033DCF305
MYAFILLELLVPVLAGPPAIAQSSLTATRDRNPVERAVVSGLLEAEEPETLVRTDVPQPDGSVRLYAAWTAGGGPLADHIDYLALARGLDAWSWIEILTHCARTTHRGRIEVRSHPLRQILADVEPGHRGSDEHRANFARMLAANGAQAGIPAWAGVGPLLWHRTLERHWRAR